jgi:hypothetical protein
VYRLYMNQDGKFKLVTWGDLSDEDMQKYILAECVNCARKNHPNCPHTPGFKLHCFVKNTEGETNMKTVRESTWYMSHAGKFREIPDQERPRNDDFRNQFIMATCVNCDWNKGISCPRDASIRDCFKNDAWTEANKEDNSMIDLTHKVVRTICFDGISRDLFVLSPTDETDGACRRGLSNMGRVRSFNPKDIVRVWRVIDWSKVVFDRHNLGLVWERVPGEIKGLKVDDPILVRDSAEGKWVHQHFAAYENGTLYAWSDGRTSYTATGMKTAWTFYKRAPREAKS